MLSEVVLGRVPTVIARSSRIRSRGAFAGSSSGSCGTSWPPNALWRIVCRGHSARFMLAPVMASQLRSLYDGDFTFPCGKRYCALGKRITITIGHTRAGLSAPDERPAACSSPHAADVWNENKTLRPMVCHGTLMTRPQLLRRLGAGAASGSPLRISRP